MKVTVLHDESGKILGISTHVALQQVGSRFTKVEVVPGPGQRTLDVELSSEQESKPLTELHKEFHVDVASHKLVKKA